MGVSAERDLTCCFSTIQGTLPKTRHFLFVEDVVEAFLLLAERGAAGETYNVGGGFEVPIVRLAHQLVRMVRFDPGLGKGQRVLDPGTCCGIETNPPLPSTPPPPGEERPGVGTKRVAGVCPRQVSPGSRWVPGTRTRISRWCRRF